MSTTLMELCEPVFLEVCRVNRQFRQPDRGGVPDPARVRADFKRVLDEARSRAGGHLGMDSQFAKVERALVALMDDVIKTSSAPWTHEWKSMYEESFDAAYMDEFYTKLDELMGEPPSELTRDRLAIFYNCLGLGFMGKAVLPGVDRNLPRRKMSEIRAARLAELTEPSTERPLLPDLEKIVDRREFIKPATDPLIPAAIALVVMTLGLVVGTVYLYKQGQKSLSEPLARIIRMDDAIAQQVRSENEKPQGEGKPGEGRP